MSSHEQRSTAQNDVDTTSSELGDDVRRVADNQNSALAAHPASGIAGKIDAGTTDLDDDEYRSPANQDSLRADRPEVGSEGGSDAGTMDHGDDQRGPA